MLLFHFPATAKLQSQVNPSKALVSSSQQLPNLKHSGCTRSSCSSNCQNPRTVTAPKALVPSCRTSSTGPASKALLSSNYQTSSTVIASTALAPHSPLVSPVSQRQLNTDLSYYSTIHSCLLHKVDWPWLPGSCRYVTLGYNEGSYRYLQLLTSSNNLQRLIL